MKMSSIAPSPTKKKSFFTTLDIVTSLRPYKHHIEALLDNEETIKAGFYQFILNNISKYPELEKPFNLDDFGQFTEALEFIYATLSYDLLSTESDNLWAFSTPFQPKVFYCTPALYNIVNGDNKMAELNNIIDNSLSEIQELRLIYSFILYRLYGYESPENDMYYSFMDELTGLQKYYLINFDFKFVELHTEGVLPKLDFETLHAYMQNENELQELKQILPLKNFKFEGFSILRCKDVKTQHLVSNIENLISNRENQDAQIVYEEIIRSLKIVIQKSEIEIGLLPFLKINNQFVFDNSLSNNSIIANTRVNNDAEQSVYSEDVYQYFKNPKPLYFNDLSKGEEEKYPFLTNIRAKGIASLVLLPVLVNKKLTGLIELYAKKKGAINKNDISLLNIVLPQIGQMFQNNINEFEANIENVIKQNFTSLHPSVQWKFNETAWLYIRDNSNDNATSELRKIQFKEVYPLYGAIDIRNSTLERNLAVQKDMLKQLSLLKETLLNISKKVKLDLIQEMLFECKKWTKLVGDFINSSEEYGLNNFLTLEVEPLLRHLKENLPETQKVIDLYLDATYEIGGVTYENRKKLEKSIKLINKVINNHLEAMVKDLQLAYPFYFEKFRTDGVEYDIYIGQSIAPDRPFDVLYLANARLWQLKSMASIVRISQQLSPQLPTFLETTNLIFAHSNAIDISFRNDERRFDVEGAYNIRYQMIKKRIDKVNIKDTEERLTQPGKIAIVYFNQKEADEYIRFINSLIVQDVFTDSLEYLDLEDLQGVAGLKALRVSVKVP